MARPKKQHRQELSLLDKKYVRDNYLKMTLQELSFNLDKPDLLIAEFIEKNLKTKNNEPINCPVLRSKYVWRELQQQFSPEELNYFEQSYNSMSEQFKDDIMATEEKQVFQAIELEIFMHRNKKLQYSSQLEIERLEKMLNDLDDEDADIGRKQHLSDLLNSARVAIPATAKQYNEYSDKYTKILGALKATREQRIKVLESSKQDFLGLIKALETKEYRDKEVRQMEIMKAALEAEKKRLSELHTYKDGKVDSPILNSDTYSKIK